MASDAFEVTGLIDPKASDDGEYIMFGIQHDKGAQPFKIRHDEFNKLMTLLLRAGNEAANKRNPEADTPTVPIVGVEYGITANLENIALRFVIDYQEYPLALSMTVDNFVKLCSGVQSHLTRGGYYRKRTQGKTPKLH